MRRRLVPLVFALMLLAPTSALADVHYGLMDKSFTVTLPFKYAQIIAEGDNTFNVVPYADGKRIPDYTHPFWVDGKGNKVEKTSDKPANLVLPAGLKYAAVPISKYCAPSKEYFLISDDSGKIGLCDLSGKVLIQPEYVNISILGEGLAAGAMSYGAWSLIKIDTGLKLAEYQNMMAEHGYGEFYCDGLLRVHRAEEVTGYLDTNGTFVIEPNRFSFGGRFCEGLASVVVNENGKRSNGYIDRTGKIVLRFPDNKFLTDFSAGLAIIRSTPTGQGNCGAVDHEGRYVIPAMYQNLEWCAGKLAGKRGGQFRIIDKNGTEIGSLPSNVIKVRGDSSDEPIMFWVKSSKSNQEKVDDSGNYTKGGYADLSGNILVQPIYDDIGPFDHGFARVAMRNPNTGKFMYGLIDRNGKAVVPTEYADLNPCGDTIVVALESNPNQKPTFNSDLWKNPMKPGARGFDLMPLWKEFLEQYDLIGMPYSRVVELLGSGDVLLGNHSDQLRRITFGLRGFGCGNSSSYLELEFDSNDQVRAWSINGFQSRGESITDNRVVRNVNAAWTSNNLVKKHP